MEIFDFYQENDTPAGKSRIDGLREIIRKLFLFTEISLLLVSLTWASSRLPSAVRISGEFFRRILAFAAGHLAVFVLGNAIVLTLLVKSRRQRDLPPCPAEIGCCAELSDNGRSPPPAAPEEIVYQDKRTILEVRGVHRRSRSDKCAGKDGKGGCGRRLRRVETAEMGRKAAEVVDDLSNEEFQRAIEAFIAKQVKFHQEEKVAIVLQG